MPLPARPAPSRSNSWKRSQSSAPGSDYNRDHCRRGGGFLTDGTLVPHRDLFAGDAPSGEADWGVARTFAGRESTRCGCLSDDPFAP
jgi:hypothetical protein